MHFRAILRTLRGERYAVPEGEQVQVQIDDPNNKQVLQAKFPVSSFGTIHGDLALPSDAALGYYGISVSAGGARQYGAGGGFQVEEYKKPEYEVQVHIAKPHVLQGEVIDATIQARYYFGEPVAGANVKYVVHTAPYWSPFIEREDEEQEFGPAEALSEEGGDEADAGGYAGEQVSEQSGRLDADGLLTIHVPTSIDGHHRDVRYRIEARVTDEGNREISGASAFAATYGSFAVGISTDSYVYQVGKTTRATVQARDYDGHPVATPIHLDLLRWQPYGSRQEVATMADATTDATGQGSASLSLSEPGSFLVRVSAKTPAGRQVEQTTWVWVTGSGESTWYGPERTIQMIADKKSYQSGDTAHVLVLTGVPEAYVLVSTEGRTIRSRQVVHATSPSVTVDIPVGQDDQPNMWVSAAFLHDDQFYLSQKSLKVPATAQQLHIEIQPAKTQFQPGEKANYTVLVHDAAGKPVSGEFSLGVVDEAIYAIQPDTDSNIYDSFYGTGYDRVATESSLNFYFNGEAGKRAMFLASREGGRSLAQLKPSEPLAQPRIRKDFPDTALWVAELRTDGQGRAQADLTFPDSLTTWRATVRGVTADTKVGSAIDRVLVRKNLMVRLAVPRFFLQGDEVTISAIVHNYLETTKKVTISLDLKGLDVLEGNTKQVEIASKTDIKVDWRVRVQPVHEAQILAKALTTGESDAMEVSLPVIPFGVKVQDARSGALSGDRSEQTTSINLPADTGQSAPSMDISVSPSIAGSLFGALDYLTSYPYGCTEQTMSSFLPDIIVAKAMKNLHLQSTIDTPELEKKIAAGIEHLRDFQHEDGGWGWWQEDQSLIFMTAYVVSGYGQAQAAGYDVNRNSLQRGQQFLRSALDQYPNMRPDLRAYVVYALESTGSASPQMLEVAWQARDSMATQGLSLLGLALQTSGDTQRAIEVAHKIEQAAMVEGDEAHWDASYDYLMEFEFDNSAESTAYAVQLLTRAIPSSPLLPKAAFWLVNHRSGGYFWDSTEQTAMVIFGLTEYVATTHELEANFKAEVYVNGKQVLTRQLTAADAFNPVQPKIHLDSADLRAGMNDIQIRKEGAGRLYWSVGGQYYSSKKHLIQNNKLSLNITRDYFHMTPVQTDNKVTYRLDPLSGGLRVGDLVAVRVTVSGGEWRYLLIADPIPAGAEFVRRDDLYTLDQRPAWWEYFFVRREFHDDHAAFFQTYFSGTHEYIYLLKVVNPGKFRVSPAMVQPMYQPSEQATSDAANWEVTQ